MALNLAQAPLDEPAQAGHHPQSGPFASHVDVAVIGVANESVTTPGKLGVELVQHDVREQRRQRRALRHAFVDADHDTVRQDHPGLEHAPDQHEQPPI